MFIINGKIITMEEDGYAEGFIRTAGSIIVEIGSMEEFEKKYDVRRCDKRNTDEEILDINGAWVMPGIIEAHAHIGITEEKWGVIGDDCNEQTRPVTPELRAIDAINPMDPAFHDAIKAGITSVMVGPGSSNVVGGQFVFMKTQGRCVDNMIVKNPAAMKVAFGENPKTAFGDKDVYPGTRMGVAALLRKTLFEAKQYYEKHYIDQTMHESELTQNKNVVSNNIITQSNEVRDFTLESWVPVFKKEIPLKVHAHRADDILTAIRIAKEFDVDITIDHGTESHLIVDEIKESGFPVIVGTDLTSRSKIEVQNMNFKTNKILRDAEVLFAITTDHPVALIQYLPICAGLAVRNGLEMKDAMEAITINPAKICRVDDRVGSLKVGKDADIAIFDDNPLETFTNTLYTIIDGEIVYRKEDM